MGGDVFKASILQVSVEAVSTAQSAEVEVDPAIAVDVTGGDPGAIEADLILRGVRGREGVREENARLGGCDGFEADLGAAGREGHRRGSGG